MATMSGDGGVASPVPVSEESADDGLFGDPATRGRRRQVARRDQLSEAEQFRLFQRFMEQQRRSDRRGLREESDEDEGPAAGNGRGNAGPPPEWDGTTSFEDYQIRARLWIATTKNRPHRFVVLSC